MKKPPKKMNSAFRLSRPCYAILCAGDTIAIAFGGSAVAAWKAAEQLTGETIQRLKKHGCRLVEGEWNGDLSHADNALKQKETSKG